MTAFRQMVFCAVLAGLIAGICLTLAQKISTIPLIENAEMHEKHEHVHPQQHAQKFTLVSNLVISIGFAFLVTALAGLRKSVHWQDGLKWAFLGFFMFFLLPTWTIAPGLPGGIESDLNTRQGLWLLACAVGALTGWYICYGSLWSRILCLCCIGIYLWLVPQHQAQYELPILQDLSQSFYWTVFGSQALFWLLLGVLISLLYPKFKS